MSSTFVADTTDDSSSAGNTVIIIVNDDTGNISVDQEMLQQLLTSQENTTLSVVRVNEGSGDNSTDVNMTVEEISGSVLKGTQEEPMETDEEITQINGGEKAEMKSTDQAVEPTDPLLTLDQEEIEKIEHALQAEAGQFFGNILPQEAGLDDLLDPELTGDPDDGAVSTVSLDHCYSAVQGTAAGNPRSVDSSMNSEVDSSDSVSTGKGGGRRRQPSPKRRSQRQIDRQEMEQLKKIRAENEELLKKEKEEMNQLQQASPSKKEPETPAEETVFVAIPGPPLPEASPPAAPTQPLSRLAVIRQELQQKILSVDPIKAKVPMPTSQQPAKSPLPKSQTPIKTPQTVSAKVTPTPPAQPETPTTVNNKPPLSQTPQSPRKEVDAGRDSPLSRVSTSGGVTRPRRENRQPPKHLREAFNQLEFEGIERSVKKTSVKGMSSPEHSSSKTKDGSTAEEKFDESNGSSPSKKNRSKDEDDEEDDDFLSGESDSDENEDDPDRLWCVCREPHNNRFMICCDKCEDWFHGKCVGVTRAMGRELELKGLEWICPKCVRQEFAATQGPFVHLQDIAVTEKTNTSNQKSPSKHSDKNVMSPESIKVAKEKAKLKAQTTERRVRVSSSGSGTIEEPVTAPRRCVVVGCKNDARPNSVYCSDACIVSHARDSLIAMSKEKTKQAQLQEPPSPSTPTSTTSSGSSKWKESVEFGQLMSQPTPPLSSKSKAINQLKKSISSDGTNKPSNLTDDTPVPVMERKTGKILTGSSAPKVANLEQWLKDNATYEVIKPASLPRPNKPRLPSLTTTPTASSPMATKAASPATPIGQAPSPASSSSTTRSKPSIGSKRLSDSSSKQKIVRKRSVESSKDEDTPKKVQADPESTRASAKSSLKDALWNRCKEATDLKVEEQTVEQVAADVEEALYRLFNKDVGVKYKAKYRSLIFNIKDPKNLGLFRKIVEKQITPGQLVKMTGEELASKELAEWREREAKHQLDIIQKTELELMSMSNKYLVKTHKGEEIIEEAGKALDEGESAASSTIVPPPLLEALQDTTSKHKSHLFDLNCQICSGKIKEDEAEKDKSSTSSSSTSRKKDEKSSRRSSHHSESSSKRSDHKDRDKKKKDHDKDRSHHHSSRSKDRHHRHRSDKEREKEKDKEKKKEEVKKEGPVSSQAPEVPKEQPESKTEVKVETTVVATNESEALPAVSKDGVTEPQSNQEIKKEEESVSKQEPTSTVSIKTPEQQPSPPEVGPIVWKGVINSAETGKVNVVATDMSGSADLTDLDMPSSLDVVGRIRPEMVWDYVNQTRRAGTREIVVFKFTPATDADRKHYSTFLSHMYKSNRFAVVGAVSKLIKDFYVVPLPKDSPIPLALATLSTGTKSLDENRTASLLLGVIVRARRKRAGDQAGNGGASVPSKAAKVAKISAKSTPPSSSNSPSLSYVPTSRADSKKGASIKSDLESNAKGESESRNTKDQADDAPYSPGQLLAEDDEPTPVAADEDLLKQQAMLEELTRQIEAQKQELASMSAEVASTTSPEVMIPGLGEPVIPGLGEPSTSATSTTTTGWASNNTRVTPSTDPPFEHPAKAKSAALDLNLSNLQDIISTIQKKEMELKMTKTSVEQLAPTNDRPLPKELFSPHDVDMRIAPPSIPVQPVPPKAMIIPPVEKKKPSLLNQLTDEELLAKAMEMEMEQAGIPPAPMQGPPFFSPPRGPYPPMGPGIPPGPPMMGHPRPFHSPPFMGPRSPYHSPTGPGAGFRPRHNKKKR